MKTPRSIRYSMSRPWLLQVGMSLQAMSPAILSFTGRFVLSKTQSGFNWPARHCATASIGLYRGVDVLPDELPRDFAAALVGDVGELRAGRLLERDGDCLVFRLRAGAAHFHGAGRVLGSLDVILRRLVGRVTRHPENELVERHHGDGGQILPRERDAGREWRGEQVRERDDELVRVAFRALDVEEALAARSEEHTSELQSRGLISY